MTGPRDPIAAVTHPDPYPYYAELGARRLYRDDTLGLWVAASASAVTSVLESDACRVRPAAEPVPNAIVGSPAGDIFGRLVRMNDGEAHAAMKPAVQASLAPLDASRVAAEARRWAGRLTDELEPKAHPDGVTEFAFRLSVYVVGSLIGLAPDRLRATAEWMSDFVRCIAPGGTTEQIEKAKAAANELIVMFRGALATSSPASALLPALAREASRARRADADVVANAIGFLSQAYEATAGLIGNTLVTLARHRAIADRAAADVTFTTAVVREVVRWDPPVQNTRRFVARDAVIAGQPMREGDVVLVVLAAANRDPAANPDPARFDPGRAERRAFTFGAGVHACPGETLATGIAAAGVERLLAIQLPLEPLAERITYRASGNTRIPLFGARARLAPP